MTDQKLLSKLANVPLAKPSFDALGMTSPILVQMNPNGKWESCAPNNLDEEKLRYVVQHLIKSQAVSAAQSYCCQYSMDSQKKGVQSSNTPIIMMPIYPADQSPFDTECENEKTKNVDKKTTIKTKKLEVENESDKDKNTKKAKKRGFVMQRLTDFDLMSQW